MKSKQQIRTKKQARPQAPQVAVKRSWQRPLLLALAVLLAGGATWAFCELVWWNKVPAELVGKWVVTEGPDEGGTVDFYRHGTMVAKVNNAGMEGVIEARIRVEGKKIHVTTRHQQTGQVGTRVQTIKTLDEDHLVLEDERGRSVKLERAK